MAVSHLSCLSRQFLAHEVASTSDIIPRGGQCDTCNTYILWGDIIRGCYRRREGGATPEADEDMGGLDGYEDEGGLFEPEDDGMQPTRSPSSSSILC